MGKLSLASTESVIPLLRGVPTAVGQLFARVEIPDALFDKLIGYRSWTSKQRVVALLWTVACDAADLSKGSLWTRGGGKPYTFCECVRIADRIYVGGNNFSRRYRFLADLTSESMDLTEAFHWLGNPDDESGFLRAIQAADDVAEPLSVFLDWLVEQGDERAALASWLLKHLDDTIDDWTARQRVDAATQAAFEKARQERSIFDLLRRANRPSRYYIADENIEDHDWGWVIPTMPHGQPDQALIYLVDRVTGQVTLVTDEGVDVAIKELLKQRYTT